MTDTPGTPSTPASDLHGVGTYHCHLRRLGGFYLRHGNDGFIWENWLVVIGTDWNCMTQGVLLEHLLNGWCPWSSSIYKRWAWTIAELIVTWLFESAHAEWIFPATLSTNTEQLLWIYGLSPKFTYKVVQPMARWGIPTSPGYPHKSKPPTRTNRRGSAWETWDADRDRDSLSARSLNLDIATIWTQKKYSL